jgi:hypothetical protein
MIKPALPYSEAVADKRRSSTLRGTGEPGSGAFVGPLKSQHRYLQVEVMTELMAPASAAGPGKFHAPPSQPQAIHCAAAQSAMPSIATDLPSVPEFHQVRHTRRALHAAI